MAETNDLVMLLLWGGIAVASILMLVMVIIQQRIESDVAKIRRLNREWEEAVRRIKAGEG